MSFKLRNISIAINASPVKKEEKILASGARKIFLPSIYID